MATYNPGDTVTLNYWDGARPYTIPADAVAVIVNTDGTVEDVALNWETAESMILQDGYVGIPVGDDNRERYGDTFDRLRELWLDCWT